MRLLPLVLAACVTPGTIGENDPPDADGDGSHQGDDCDDLEPRAAPGLDEICDGIDNDCDGAIDREDCERLEEHVQTMRLDLLIVVDDSGSMADFQTAIATSFDDLLQWIVGPDRDAHVGVITMDMENPAEQGRLISANGRRFIDPTMDYPEALGWASVAIQRGVDDQFYAEAGLDVAYAAVTQHQAAENTGFRRDDAHLAVLFLTDEEDEFSSLDAYGFVTAMRALPGTADFAAHAVVSDDPACLQSPGEQYIAAAELTGGLVQSICASPDFGQFLSAVGQLSAQHGLLDRFPLEERALPGSVRVSYALGENVVIALGEDEVLLTQDQRTVVLLAPPPPNGAKVQVRYGVDEGP